MTARTAAEEMIAALDASEAHERECELCERGDPCAMFVYFNHLIRKHAERAGL